MMAGGGYNPHFVDMARRKQALARMRRAMREAEQDKRRLEAAARDAADAIIRAALDEAQLIMERAYEAAPRKPVARIVGEVSEEYSIAPSIIRGRARTARAKEARRVAISRTYQQRPDLTTADIARMFDARDSSVVRKILKMAGVYRG